MQQCLLDPKVREKYEKLVPIVWLHLDLALILKIGAVRFEKFRKDAGERREMLAECRNPEMCAKIARRVVLDQTLLDEEWLRGATGLGHAEFFYLVGCFEDAIRANPGSPLFRNGVDEARKSCRGNRCSLATEHMLCMVLYHMWTGCAQDALQGTFGVDQSTASRNIRMVRGHPGQLQHTSDRSDMRGRARVGLPGRGGGGRRRHPTHGLDQRKDRKAGRQGLEQRGVLGQGRHDDRQDDGPYAATTA